MRKKDPKVVVVTPIKNESWILERFLSVTSQFADHIIVADQDSTDNSLQICREYPKVTVIRNDSGQYDEASRQILLIRAAREKITEHKVILALDADEILAADAMGSIGWQSMLSAKPGTIIFFEKQDLYPTPYTYVRYPQLFPLGYVDDGADFSPKKIHSTRVPTPEISPKLYVHDVKILHYTWLRTRAQFSKERMYCVIECISKTSPLMPRRRRYSPYSNYLKLESIKPTPKEFFSYWESLDIDMKNIQDSEYYWQDFEVLKYFNKYGFKKFWLEPIWEFDWERCRIFAQSLAIENIPTSSIQSPPKIFVVMLKIIDNIYSFFLKVLKLYFL